MKNNLFVFAFLASTLSGFSFEDEQLQEAIRQSLIAHQEEQRLAIDFEFACTLTSNEYGQDEDDQLNKALEQSRLDEEKRQQKLEQEKIELERKNLLETAQKVINIVYQKNLQAGADVHVFDADFYNQAGSYLSAFKAHSPFELITTSIKEDAENWLKSKYSIDVYKDLITQIGAVENSVTSNEIYKEIFIRTWSFAQYCETLTIPAADLFFYAVSENYLEGGGCIQGIVNRLIIAYARISTIYLESTSFLTY